MSLHSRTRRNQRGYIMLTLLLAMALLVIFAGVIAPSITFQIKRDREEELIHRGVQYSRAIRAYYKKFQRYPTKIEDLESTNNQRFLRKRYKDPMNCKNGKCADFKLLHFGEVQMALSGVGGGIIPGANPAGNPGGLSGTGFGTTPTPSLGQTQATTGTAAAAADSTQPGSQSDGTGTSAAGTGTADSGSNQLGSGQIIGGPIIGVATISKDPTIREFNHKKKYKDWVFVYDPAQDQGRLITTPYQPQLQAFGQMGTPNMNGQNGSGFGTGNSLGGSPGGMQPNTPATVGFGTPSPPSNPPQQQ